ncbi:MAG TPA: hypothetical protein VHO46_05120 [Bacteroidales bacterium]|nr:hypothetical protein [Bacteroidales bacterium]
MKHQIPEPFQFNPLKHHLGYIQSLISYIEGSNDRKYLIKTICHIGTSVTDLYCGKLSIPEILGEISDFLNSQNLNERSGYSAWAGRGSSEFRLISLRDGSVWILKLNDDEKRYIHIFPARSSPGTLRVKANTLKSAILFLAANGKDYVTEYDLNKARRIVGLSPVNKITESEAIARLVEILRKQ